MEDIKKRNKILFFTIIGLITTIVLAVIYYNANFNPIALSSFCSVNNFIDCDGVARTTEAQFFGIPLAYWGMFLYSFIILMLLADKLKNIKFLKFLEVFKHPFSYIAILGLISFIISIILLCVSLFKIQKICILCIFTYILNLLIAVLAADETKFKEAFIQSVEDFVDAIKIKTYAIAFVIVALIACGFLAYTGTSYVFVPQIKRQIEMKEFVNAKTNKYAVTGNILGKENAKYIIHIYTDYNCPICRAYDIMVHKFAKENKDVLVVHHNLPLDMECNKYLTQEFHQGSCQMAKYAVAAELQGKLWDINNKFFELRPQTSEDILKIAKNLNLDTDKLQEDANSIETMKKIQKDIDEAYSHGINGTPSTYVNGKKHIGLQTYKDFKKWVADAFKE